MLGTIDSVWDFLLLIYIVVGIGMFLIAFVTSERPMFIHLPIVFLEALGFGIVWPLLLVGKIVHEVLEVINIGHYL